MKPRKLKPEQGLLEQLSKPLRAFVADFNEHGPQSLEDLRRENNAKYVEQSVKLIALIAALRPAASDFAAAKTKEEEGAALLKCVGLEEDQMTPGLIAEAIEVRDNFVNALEAICKRQLGELQ
jgi:hypothetical protein